MTEDMNKPAEKPTCRNCGLELTGKPYWAGGPAYHPRTKEQVPSNHYGGWVCSRRCDWDAAMALEGSMPGGAGYKGNFCMAYQDRAAFDRKWSGLRCA